MKKALIRLSMPCVGVAVATAALAQPVVVAFDQGHFNVHSLETPYSLLGEVGAELGFQVKPHTGPFTEASLQGVRVLVACCARATDTGPLADRGRPAFREDEIDAVDRWVREGGAFLLVIDHFPTGGSNQAMAARFGVDVTNGYTVDESMSEPVHSRAAGGANSPIRGDLAIVFDRARGRITDHAITCGRSEAEQINRVATFPWGGSLNAPPGSVPLLLLSDQAEELLGGLAAPDRTGVTQSAAGRNQGVALAHGRGRVVVLAEARMLYDFAQPGAQNRQLAANLLRWLAGPAGPTRQCSSR
jgi:hypothetical protein